MHNIWCIEFHAYNMMNRIRCIEYNEENARLGIQWIAIELKVRIIIYQSPYKDQMCCGYCNLVGRVSITANTTYRLRSAKAPIRSRRKGEDYTMVRLKWRGIPPLVVSPFWWSTSPIPNSKAKSNTILWPRNVKSQSQSWEWEVSV